MVFTKDVKNRYKNFLIIILSIGMIAMTIIYANFTRYLFIKAYAGVSDKNWDIHFENLNKEQFSSNNTTRVITEPYIVQGLTEIRNLEVEFNKPGDFVTYTFDIVNAGDIDARLDNYMIGTPVCDVDQDLCNNIKFTIKNKDGSDIVKNTILPAGKRKNLVMTIKFEESATHMPSKKMTITNLTGVFYYVQH